MTSRIIRTVLEKETSKFINIWIKYLISTIDCVKYSKAKYNIIVGIGKRFNLFQRILIQKFVNRVFFLFNFRFKIQTYSILILAVEGVTIGMTSCGQVRELRTRYDLRRMIPVPFYHQWAWPTITMIGWFCTKCCTLPWNLLFYYHHMFTTRSRHTSNIFLLTNQVHTFLYQGYVEEKHLRRKLSDSNLATRIPLFGWGLVNSRKQATQSSLGHWGFL